MVLLCGYSSTTYTTTFVLPNGTATFDIQDNSVAFSLPSSVSGTVNIVNSIGDANGFATISDADTGAEYISLTGALNVEANTFVYLNSGMLQFTGGAINVSGLLWLENELDVFGSVVASDSGAIYVLDTMYVESGGSLSLNDSSYMENDGTITNYGVINVGNSGSFGTASTLDQSTVDNEGFIYVNSGTGEWTEWGSFAGNDVIYV